MQIRPRATTPPRSLVPALGLALVAASLATGAADPGAAVAADAPADFELPSPPGRRWRSSPTTPPFGRVNAFYGGCPGPPPLGAPPAAHLGGAGEPPCRGFAGAPGRGDRWCRSPLSRAPA